VPTVQIPFGFRSLNAATERSRRIIFVIFQRLMGNVLPVTGQKMPGGAHRSAFVKAAVTVTRHRRTFVQDDKYSRKRSCYAHQHCSAQACAQHMIAGCGRRKTRAIRFTHPAIFSESLF